MKIIPIQRLLSISSVFAASIKTRSSCVAAMATMSTSTSSTPMKVRVATYNVLSSHLSEPEYYSTLNPEHLNPTNRLPSVLQKIDAEIEKSSVVCLQEVSHDWAGRFHAHFCNKGYHLVTGFYGKKFNGYMGVAVAFKTADYKVIDVDVSRLADKREEGWPRKPNDKDRNSVARFASNLYGFGTTTTRSFLALFGLMDAKPKYPPQDAWDMAQNRFNQLVTVTLECKTTQKKFAVGCYHMPCAYYAPMVMTIHTDLAARHVQKLASTSTATAIETDENENDSAAATTTTTTSIMPYILAGDWNIKPDGSSYRLLTTGKMDKGDPEWPTPKHGMEWSPTSQPMRSAYATHDSNGKEPDFTNYSRVKEDEPFIDTLDYVFLSDEWRVTGVKAIPHRDGSGGPFPNLDYNEPSDHLLIAADLEL